ncbi:MAG: RHS repeat-associated core domain-containing protein, partial [Verrucomicrobia bacterium]|nr:RHS repeat-associated core domain-containing protein [Verrucomicrobiota bacterium]
TGHHYHEKSGLCLAMYRAYDANLGRWLSEDPIGEAGGVNLYGYVGNGPIVNTDPLGLEDKTPQGYEYSKKAFPGMDGHHYYSAKTPLPSLDKHLADSAGKQKGECPSLVKALAGLEGTEKNGWINTESWIKGPSLQELLNRDDSDPQKQALKEGVAIATFGKDGKFHSGDGHAALYVGLTSELGKDGWSKCSIFDQFPQDTNGNPKLPGTRSIPFSGATPEGHGNNWSEFSIILTK